jgi:ABC-type bacteriocin/lantibiotic exporter with double-glycine peptidase domain
MGLLGELDNYEGSIYSSGNFFYVSQQPWIFTSSIRQNIIFGKEFDREKFDKIVEACSLKKDLQLMPLGENTLVGEKGINLSGGQRARICMFVFINHSSYFLDTRYLTLFCE